MPSAATRPCVLCQGLYDDCERCGGNGVEPPILERDGIKVGDRVVLIGHIDREWPAEVIGFTSLPCDVVVRWTGIRPSLDDESTVCRKQLQEVRHA